MNDIPTPQRHRLIIPAFAGIYAGLINFAELVLRAGAGLALVTHGYPKIQEPLARVEMVESLGFYPGFIWSPALAITEFFGGILIAIGLLTRPAAFAAMFGLAVASYYHWIPMEQGYAGAEKALLWAVIMFFFVIRGGNRFSVDARLHKEF